jgi:aryl-phospho-beta-D-glucosidase BglC (GH1 family)
MKKFTLLVVVGVFISFFAQAQNEHAFEMNAKLGNGINIGNGFDAPNPGDWGVVITEDFFIDIAKQGFDHIRLPVRWSAHAEDVAPYTIDEAFMDTVKWAVDLALENELSVVLDIHHFEELFTDPTENSPKLLGMWEQISLEFKDYPDSLYFEVMNEPHDKYTAALWNVDLVKALDIIRVENPTRMVVIGTAEWGGIGALNKLEIPATDTNLIVTIHYYEPFNFTHQDLDWTDDPLPGGVTWDSTANQIQYMKNDFNIAQAYSDAHNVPIYVGEFGALEGADDSSRKKWTGHLIKEFENYNFSSAYWMYNSVYDVGLDCYRNFLLTPLTGSVEECDCSKYDDIVVVNPMFNSVLAPWSMFKNGDAEGEFTLIDGEARLEVITNGTEVWHLQVAQTGVQMVFGSTYKFEFEAYASTPIELTGIVSENGGDYASYGTINADLTDTKQLFSVEFLYEGPTDDNRIVFECGLLEAQYIYFDNINLTLLEAGIPVTSIEVFNEDGEKDFMISETGGTVQLVPVVLPDDASSVEVTYKVKSGASIATVSETGLVTATGVTNGYTYVEVIAADGSGIKELVQVQVTNQGVGIDDVEGKMVISIAGKQFSVPGTRVKTVILVDVSGKMKNISNNFSGNNIVIDESQLSDGLNVIQIETDKGVYAIKNIK